MSLSRILFVATAVVCIVTGGAAPAMAELRGFNPDTVRERLGRQGDAPRTVLGEAARARVNRLDNVAQVFRLSVAQDPVGLLAQLDEDEREIAAGILSVGPPSAWRYFFAGSIVLVGGIASDTPRVGYYNPIVDGLVLTDMRDTRTSFRLTGMQAMTGHALRGDAGTPILAPGWMRAEGTPGPIALVEAASAAAAAFERRYPLTAEALPPFEGAGDGLVAERARITVALLSTVRQYPEWTDVLAAFDPRLQPGSTAQRHAAVAELPAAAKEDLRLAGILRGEPRSMATFVSPNAPRLILFVDVEGGAGTTRPSLGRAALVDVFASRRPN